MRLPGMFTAMVLIIGVACSDKDVVEIDKTAPLVDTITPVRNEMFDPGDTVFIRALISDDRELWKGSVHIHDPDTVFNYKFQIEAKTFEIDTFFVVNDPLDKIYIIYVDGFDKAENLTSQQRAFYQYH